MMRKLPFPILLVLAICALRLPAFSTEASGLVGVAWTLTELQGKPFTPPAEGHGGPTLRLDAEKKTANGFSGVNRFFGSYESTGGRLKFGPIAGTKMAGPPERMAVESSFLAMLASVTAWRIGEGALSLLHEDQIVARFAPGGAAEK